MKRMTCFRSYKLMRSCAHKYVGGLDGDDQIVIAHAFYKLNLLKSRVYYAFSSNMSAVFLNEILLERS